MKRVLVVIVTIAAISCSKSESTPPKQTCWACNLQDPLSGRVDHVDTCLNGTTTPIVLVINGVTYSADCLPQ